MKLTSIMKKAAIRESLLPLKESDGMDRAQLILAAKAVTEELQDVAEKLAKMEAEGIMPLLDGIRTSFGPEFADRLSNDSAAALRQALEAVKQCKETIGGNIDNMQQIVTGEGPGNDMGTGVGLPDQQAPDAVAAPEAPADDGQGAPDASAAPEETPGAGDEDIEDVFGDDAPVGRDTKESVIDRNINMLRESSNPDRVIMTNVMALMKKGMNGKQAVLETARMFDIDAGDVVDVIREQTK